MTVMSPQLKTKTNRTRANKGHSLKSKLFFLCTIVHFTEFQLYLHHTVAQNLVEHTYLSAVIQERFLLAWNGTAMPTINRLFAPL